MTKEDFRRLQEDHKNSNVSLKNYLTEKNISVPQYYYWKKKFEHNPFESSGQFVNITSKIRENQESSEVVLQYPNGIKIIFRNYPGSKTLLELSQY